MRLSRTVTGFISWGLDNLLPPFVRDNKLLMTPAFRLLFGNKASLFAEFKQRAPFLTPGELDDYYANLADVHLKRDTDLTSDAMAKIMANVLGETVLDIACGRGTLSCQIGRQLGKQVTGIDIHPPKEQLCGQSVRFLPGRVEQIDFPDKSFDTVVCAHTLEHTVAIDKAVSELRRVARRRLIIVVPRQRSYRFTFDLHLHFFPYPHSLQLLMKNPDGEIALVGNDFYYQEDVS
jgi:SAM-dependent methyltransferase